MDVLLSATNETDRSGNFLKTMAVITDVTAEKAAEEKIKKMNLNLDKTVKARTQELQALSDELSEQRDFLNAFIQNTDSIIRIKDVEGKFLLVNKKYLEMHDLESQGELLGKSYQSIPTISPCC